MPSPRPGFSILTTSAPRSPRSDVHHGPVASCDRSITRMPASAAGRSAIARCVPARRASGQPTMLGCPAMAVRMRHRERHFGGGDRVRDVILGMSDGLTTPFALAAGLAGATTSNLLVVVGGLAEIAAGAISMGLGGYLAAQSAAETYRSELARETHE